MCTYLKTCWDRSIGKYLLDWFQINACKHGEPSIIFQDLDKFLKQGELACSAIKFSDLLIWFHNLWHCASNIESS